MGIKLTNLWEQLRSSYWFVPSLMALLAIALSFVMVTIDTIVQADLIRTVGLIWAGGPEGARGLLSTVASSMINVAGVTFSITIATLTLASSQFGPHLLRNFMRDTSNQVVLGTFIATFLYCLLVLRTVRVDEGDSGEFVPYISVTLGIVFALASIGVLIYFIHHIASSIQAPNVIATVNQDLERTIDQLFPQALGHNVPSQKQQHVEQDLPEGFERESCSITASGNGYIQAIDNERLMELATEHDLLLRLERRPGHFIVRGSDLVLAWPAERVDDELKQHIIKAFVLGRQNTLTQDVEFAINQLVEIAVRALSPGINDPFTVNICVDWLGAALSRLADKDFPSSFRYDDHDRLRIIANPLTFSGLTDAAFNQIRQNALSRGMVSVIIRLLETIAVVAERVDDEEGYTALMRHTNMMMQDIRREVPESPDRADIEERYQAVMRVLEQRRSIIFAAMLELPSASKR